MSGMRILVTGSRDWTDSAAVTNAIVQHLPVRDDAIDYENVTLVHGGARGLDTIADRLGRAWRFNVEVHPADWKTYGRAAGHRRNAEMVALGADVCLAFPIGESRGTRGCVALAEKAGIPVVVHEGAATP